MRVRDWNASGLATGDEGRSTDDITGVRPSVLGRMRHAAADGHPARERGPADGEGASSTAATPRVLLAEGDPSERRALADSLRNLGMNVDEAPDGGRLLVSVAAQYKDGHTPEEVDVIVSAVRLPVCSGLQVFRGVRAAHWATPVLLMTEYPTREVRDTVARLGARLLVKPFDMHDFEHAVLELVARQRPGFRPLPSPER